MENQILLSVLKSQLRIEETKQRVYGYATDMRTEYSITQEIIWELNEQIRELEAVLTPNKDQYKGTYEVKTFYAPVNGYRHFVSDIKIGDILNEFPMSQKDAELLCKLANNQR